MGDVVNMAAATAGHRPHPVPTLRKEDVEKWISIYPAYINKDKTRQEGRRIPLEKAVKSPTLKEIYDVIATTGLQLAVERKLYSRETSKEPPYWGRLRVEIKNKDGMIVNPEFKTREDVMVFAAANTIPTSLVKNSGL